MNPSRVLLEQEPAEFALAYARADSKTVRSVLKRVAASKSAYAVFLRAWVDPTAPERTWSKALKAITFFTKPYKLSYKKKWLVQMATDPQLVEAVRAAAVGARDVPDEMIALLAIDGSEASADALMPSFAAATSSKDQRLDVLQELKRFRLKTPSMVAMLQGATTSRDARIAVSPAVAFAESIGLPRTPGLHLTLGVNSLEPAGVSVPRVQVHLTVDSREVNWFSVSAYRLGNDAMTTFDSASLHVDELKLGAAPPDQWPTWLARTAHTLLVKWAPDVFVSSSFRGAKRDQIAHWLRHGLPGTSSVSE